MRDPFRPDARDQSLLSAFAGAMRTLHATAGMPSTTDEEYKRFVAACSEHDEFRSIVYSTPPRTLQGALAKLLMLAEPELGLAAGARGSQDGDDVVCVNQVATFLASVPGVAPSLDGGDHFQTMVLTLALAETKRRAAGNFMQASWFPVRLSTAVAANAVRAVADQAEEAAHA